MALPADLRRAIFLVMPFDAVETSNAALLATWLRSRGITTHLNNHNSHNLQPHERYLKIAAWAGVASYTNQLFLPYGLASLQSAMAGRVDIFIDTFLRGQENDQSLLAVLRQLRFDPAGAEKMLAYICIQNSVSIYRQQLLDGMLRGQIVFTPKALKILRNFPVGLSDDVLAIFAGVAAALGLEYQMHSDYREQFFVVGYVLAGGRDLSDFRFYDISLTTATAIMAATLNLDIEIAPADEQYALEQLAERPLRYLRQGREFPMVSVALHSPAILQQRAGAMLTVVTQLYQASPARQDYLTLLQFFLRPEMSAAELAGVVIPNNYLEIFGRWDLMPEKRFDENGCAAFVEDLPRFAAFLVAHPVYLRRGERILLENAILQGQLPAVAYVSQNSDNVDEQTLENFRNLRGAQHRNWHNSFVLQWLAAELKFTNVTPVVERSDEMSKTNLVFDYAGHVVFEPVNPYDLLTWHVINPEIPAPTRDERLVRVAELLE